MAGLLTGAVAGPAAAHAAADGTNVLLVKAVDAARNQGSGSVEFTVDRLSPPVAHWRLETGPGVGQSSALHDAAPAPVDSPLTASDVRWLDDVRLLGGQTATFNGTSSAAGTAEAVVDTSGSFSVAAWVRPGTVPATDMTFAAQEGSGAAGFQLGVSRPAGSPAASWSFSVGGSVAAAPVIDARRWTQVTGEYDAADKKVRLYVDGAEVGVADHIAAPSVPGRFLVGRGLVAGAPGNWWNGSVADVVVFDRALVPSDFTGRLASDPASGGFSEPGLLDPARVGAWNFEAAMSCRWADLRDTCEAPDTTTAWGRWLALTRGADLGQGHTAGGSGLWLDDRYFPGDEEPVGGSTQEFGRSAVKAGHTPPDADGNEFTIWEERPVLRTDQSFTISAWARLAAGSADRAVVAQTGAHESIALIRYDAGSGKWEFSVSSADGDTAVEARVLSPDAAQAETWTHLTGVYDAGRSELRLHVDGGQATSPVPFIPAESSGPLLVGQALRDGRLTDQWAGGIDDVEVFQGALTSAAVGHS